MTDRTASEQSRRSFLKTAAALGVGASLPLGASLGSTGLPALALAPGSPLAGGIFSAGIWSGDPTPDSVIVGTRAQVPGVTSPEIRVQISSTPDFVNSSERSATVGPDTDYTAKFKIDKLDPNSWYYYRFFAEGAPSPIGRTRTAPDPGTSPERLRIAFCSCQDYKAGLYTPWRAIANEDIDFVVFLGDYIYESGGSGGEGGRVDPIGTSAALDEYRLKYRLYRSDPDLQAAHANFPFIVIWDDHEVVDNYDKEVDAARMADGYRAFFEYMPIERHAVEPDRLYRSFEWGDLAELFLIDTRQYRDPEAGLLPNTIDPSSPALDADRSILGPDQKSWLTSGLTGSSRTWKLLGNQVTMMPWRILDLDEPQIRQFNPNLPMNAGLYANGDSWDGYQHERHELLTNLEHAGIDNFVILTGDVHSFWAAEIRSNFDKRQTKPVGYEFVGGSITSTFTDLLGPNTGRDIQKIFRQAFRKEIAFLDTTHKGYGILEVTHDAAICELMFVDIHDHFAVPELGARFRVAEGGTELEVAPPP